MIEKIRPYWDKFLAKCRAFWLGTSRFIRGDRGM